MPFCPNCNFFMPAVETDKCPKCGHSLDYCKLGDSNFGLCEKPVEPPTDTEVRTCPLCGGDCTRSRDTGYNFEMLGKEVQIYGVRTVAVNLQKRVITQQTVTFEGWECSAGHRTYTEARSVERDLCPMCRDVLKKFGSQIRSCSHCGSNYEANLFISGDPDTLLAEEGWTKVEKIPLKEPTS